MKDEKSDEGDKLSCRQTNQEKGFSLYYHSAHLFFHSELQHYHCHHHQHHPLAITHSCGVMNVCKEEKVCQPALLRRNIISNGCVVWYVLLCWVVWAWLQVLDHLTSIILIIFSFSSHERFFLLFESENVMWWCVEWKQQLNINTIPAH